MRHATLIRSLVFMAWGAQLADLTLSAPCQVRSHAIGASAQGAAPMATQAVGLAHHEEAHASPHGMPDPDSPADPAHAPCQCMLTCCIAGSTVLPSSSARVAAAVRQGFDVAPDTPREQPEPRSAVRRLPWPQAPPRTA